MTFHAPEKYRIKTGPMASSFDNGNNGQFMVTSLKLRSPLAVQASDGFGWEHVSVSLNPILKRCPTWEEMCFIKGLFWDAEDCVLQFHPAKNDYINNHPYCLHLWRPIGIEIISPPSILVGTK
jgi:hypothetical protein